jgi:glucuronoarabinoxylan endo-1,4-beta-xylanase
MMRIPLPFLILLAVLLGFGAQLPQAEAQCNVYMATNQQVIDGFGFSSAWCGKLSAAKNKSLYQTLGMSILRVQIMNDFTGASDGTWSAESNNAAAAHSYGAKVMGTDWYSPTANWDTNGTAYIMPPYFQADAQWLAAAVRYHHLDYCSPANEPDLGWQQWTTNDFIKFTTQYGAAIGVPLIEAESCWFADPYMETIADNPAPAANMLIPIAGGHGYGGPGTHPAELAAGKRLWMTEHYQTGGQDNMGECLEIAQEMSQYINNKFSAYIAWWVYDTDTNCNLVDESGYIHKNGYTMGQFAKWIRPGSTAVSATYNPQSKVFVTAYNVNGSVVIVAVNTNANTVSQQFIVHNSSATSLEGYQTSSSLSLADIGPFTLTAGSFTASLAAQSVTTFVQTNGVAPNLPPVWNAQDIGPVGMVATVNYTNSVLTNGIFTLTAAGNDVWNSGDAFQFVYETNGPNCALVARVAALSSTNAMAKAGVMIRTSLASNAPNAFVAVTASNGVVFQWRASTGGATSANLLTGLAAPYWVMLTATNGTFTGYCSPDGSNWTLLGTATISASSMVDAGLAFCGNGNASLSTATFDNVNTPDWPFLTPPTPVAMTATAGLEQVHLSWQEGGYATNFTVARGSVSGGPYTNIATVTAPEYVDLDLPSGTTNYYVVTAANPAGKSAVSIEVNAIPTNMVPAPWAAQDIGLSTTANLAGVPGAESFSNGTFTILGSGSDIWGTADAFRYVYSTTNTTALTLIARVESVQAIDPWSKAGVMMRDSLNANGANTFIAATPGNGVTFQYRSADGGSSANQTVAGVKAPCWVKLTRNGSTFTGYYSTDGINWIQAGTATFGMSSSMYTGLAVAAHNSSSLCAAAFEDVNAPGWAPTLPSTPANPTAVGGLERVAVNWQPASNNSGYNLYRATTSGGPYTFVTNTTATSFNDLQIVGNGTKYYYIVDSVNNLAGESLNSTEAGASTTVTAPIPWLTADIGSPAVLGSASCVTNLFTVTGSGADIYNSADAFQFIFIATNSMNFTNVARVVSVQNVNAWSKAGLMVRDSLDPGAANAFIALTPGNGATFQYRLTDGGGSSETATAASAPYWVKLVRNGTTFTGYGSANGTTWGQIGTTTLTNVTTAYVGLAVTSHNNASLCTATFDSVSVLGWPLSSPSMNLAAGGSGLTLSWPGTSGGFQLQSSTNLESGVWVNVTSPAPQMVGTNWQVALPASGDAIYYRLVR